MGLLEHLDRFDSCGEHLDQDTEVYGPVPNMLTRIVAASVASIAQLVEQRTFNPWVVGSIPTGSMTVAKNATVVNRGIHGIEANGQQAHC